MTKILSAIESYVVIITKILAAFESYVPLFQTLTFCILVIILVILLKEPMRNFISAIVVRIKQGSPIKFDKGGFEIGQQPLVKSTSEARIIEEIKVSGNPDWFKLLFKAQGKTWLKSTKAMEVPGGCVIQVTTEQRNPDGSWSNAEALTFVPNVAVVEDDKGEGRHLA